MVLGEKLLNMTSVLAVHATQINRNVDKNKTVKTALPLDFAGHESSFCARLQYFTSQRRFYVSEFLELHEGFCNLNCILLIIFIGNLP